MENNENNEFASTGQLNVGKWTEKDGVIYFSVVSDGTTGEEWIKRLDIGDNAKSILLSKDFKPTKGVKTEVAVLKSLFFEDKDRITKNIRAEADKRKLTKPNAEVACLIHEMFTDGEIKAMGLSYIVTMHDPIKDSVGVLSLLNAGRGAFGRWFYTCRDDPNYWWNRDFGFAFVVSQVDLNA